MLQGKLLGQMKNFGTWRWGLFVCAVGAVLGLFWGTLAFTVWTFTDPLGDMEYGWLIPPAAVYMIWHWRAELRARAGAPNCWAGALVCGLSLALFWLGSRGDQARLMQVGFAVMVVGVPLLFWGWSLAKVLIFPAAYLLLALPLSFLDEVTLPLRLLSSATSALLLNGFGIEVKQVGTALLGAGEAGFKLDVADPCSGIRSLVALLAITAGYAGVHRLRPWVKGALIVSAVPLAFLGNIVRLVSTAVVSHVWGERAGVLYHDQAGFLVFPVIVLTVFVLFDWTTSREQKVAPADGEEVEEVWSTEEMQRETPFRLLGAAGVVLLIVLAWVGARRLPSPAYESDRFVAQALPQEAAGFKLVHVAYCQNEQCLNTTVGFPERCPFCGGEVASVSLAELSMLPKDTRFLKGLYRSELGMSFSVTVVVSGKSRMSLHRPELCLPGQGFGISRRETVWVPLGFRSLRVNCVEAARTGEASMGLLYWMLNPQGEVLSHWARIFSDVWNRTVHNRMNRWCMITVTSSRPFNEEALESLGEFLAVWYPQVVRIPANEAAGKPAEH